MAVDAGTGKRAQTLARLVDCGLELFEARGYEQTTVAQIASSGRNNGRLTWSVSESNLSISV